MEESVFGGVSFQGAYRMKMSFRRPGARLRQKPRGGYRPVLESLEDRFLLSSNNYLQTNLTSDIPGMAQVTDPNLVNPWGIVPNPTGAFWVNDNGAGVSTLYDGAGVAQSLVVTIPDPGNLGFTSAPTGIVHNGTSDFVVQGNDAQGAAVFIFSTEDGTISAWSPAVDRNNAILEVDNADGGAVYKGLAIGSNSQGNFLYAANFRAGTVEVYDTNFVQTQLDGSFTDPRLPRGYAPFGIQNINGDIYVSYAKQDAAKHDDVAGPGHGFIDVFDTDGHLMRRLVSRGALDSPWGLVQAPDHFGRFSDDLLVGNFGNGKIHAYDPNTGAFRGTLRDADHRPIKIDGLWGLSFGNGVTTDANTLYFTAGINDEQDGLFGSLQAADNGDGTGVALPGQVALGQPASTGGEAHTLSSAPRVQGGSGQEIHPIAGGLVGGAGGTATTQNGATGELHAGPVSLADSTAIDSLFALDGSSLGDKLLAGL
jgi:uncharacterized protein (TIGR03118 family)